MTGVEGKSGPVTSARMLARSTRIPLMLPFGGVGLDEVGEADISEVITRLYMRERMKGVHGTQEIAA